MKKKSIGDHAFLYLVTFGAIMYAAIQILCG